VGGSFQWPPAKEEEDQGATATPMYINPNSGFGTTSYQSDQHQQHVQEEQHHFQQQKHHQVEQSNSTHLESSRLQQQQLKQQPLKPLNSPQSILKQVIPNAQMDPLPESIPPTGPGQNVTAPRRGMGVLKQQQPGMRVPLCGGCDTQIRHVVFH